MQIYILDIVATTDNIKNKITTSNTTDYYRMAFENKSDRKIIIDDYIRRLKLNSYQNKSFDGIKNAIPFSIKNKIIARYFNLNLNVFLLIGSFPVLASSDVEKMINYDN